MNALLIHQGALGDWVLVWPVLRGLAAGGGKVTAVTGWSKARLAARYIPGVEAANADGLDWSRLFSSDARPTGKVRELLATAELIVSFVSTGRDAWAENVARLAPAARQVFVPARPGEGWPRHVCDFHRADLESQGVQVSPVTPAARQGRRGQRVRVLLHPGSGGEMKRWPVDRFYALASELRTAGFDVGSVLGPVEMERWPPSAVAAWRAEIATRVCMEYDELADAIDMADAWVGNDSGPTHLAAHLGLATVAMFGPSPPATWAPRGAKVRVLSPETRREMEWLKPAVVARAVRELAADSQAL